MNSEQNTCRPLFIGVVSDDMARTKSAKKAARAAKKRVVFNARRKKAMKDAIKSISRLISAKSAKEALAMLPALQKAIDKAAKGGVIKPNAAARLKSRIAKRLRVLG